jgi:hypothetical protein
VGPFLPTGGPRSHLGGKGTTRNCSSIDQRLPVRLELPCLQMVHVLIWVGEERVGPPVKDIAPSCLTGVIPCSAVWLLLAYSIGQLSNSRGSCWCHVCEFRLPDTSHMKRHCLSLPPSQRHTHADCFSVSAEVQCTPVVALLSSLSSCLTVNPYQHSIFSTSTSQLTSSLSKSKTTLCRASACASSSRCWLRSSVVLAAHTNPTGDPH